MVDNPEASKELKSISLFFKHIVIRTVKPVPTISHAGRSTVRDIALKSKIVEMQIKSPLFHQSKR